MNAIKKKLQTLKIEKDLAIDRADACEQQAKEACQREDRLKDQLKELKKKLAQMKGDLDVSRQQLSDANADLDDKEKSYLMVQSELAMLNRKMQQCVENLEKTEERRTVAQTKLAQALHTCEDAKRMCKNLENRSKLDEERMESLVSQLKEARYQAEDADNKSEQISRQLALVEDELESVEDRVKLTEAQIAEKENKLFIVGNILKSLEVSEEKANQRVDIFKSQLKHLKARLKETEKRAVFAEKSVKSYVTELDMREDRLRKEKEKFKYICADLDSTFAELTGY
ncbi:tropomyosin-2-like isoform X2 [Trichogramma pretiosum]|uniref:Tropomyosin-2 n=1 Tax=Trichogramma kaykai TaxID=54128 RepID=A0ABD2X7V2_9HYME|nr:tropomyosin-2-like isoform X2 [Trichogramma pretiosum]